MAWRAIGATALLLASAAPALAQGPMSPIPLAANTYEVTRDVPAAPPPPIPPAPIAQQPDAKPPVLAAKSGKTRTVKNPDSLTEPKDADALPRANDVDMTAAMGADPAVDDAATVGKRSKRGRSRDADSASRVDSDHMAGMLNRMQLGGGDGSTQLDRGPAAFRSGE